MGAPGPGPITALLRPIKRREGGEGRGEGFVVNSLNDLKGQCPEMYIFLKV